MANEIRRTGDLRVKLAPDMLLRLEKMATSYGMPGATFAAFAIADFINRQESNAKMTRMAVMEVTRNSMAEMLNGDGLEKAVMSALPGIVTALSQHNLPLDGEAEPVGDA